MSKDKPLPIFAALHELVYALRAMDTNYRQGEQTLKSIEVTMPVFTHIKNELMANGCQVASPVEVRPEYDRQSNRYSMVWNGIQIYALQSHAETYDREYRQATTGRYTGRSWRGAETGAPPPAVPSNAEAIRRRAQEVYEQYRNRDRSVNLATELPLDPTASANPAAVYTPRPAIAMTDDELSAAVNRAMEMRTQLLQRGSPSPRYAFNPLPTMDFSAMERRFADADLEANLHTLNQSPPTVRTWDTGVDPAGIPLSAIESQMTNVNGDNTAARIGHMEHQLTQVVNAPIPLTAINYPEIERRIAAIAAEVPPAPWGQQVWIDEANDISDLEEELDIEPTTPPATTP